MDYKVLYRKYRPDDFSSIIGQDYITTILKNAISANKISHAYIFSGPRGTGKTSTAKVFAKAINCENPTPNGPCNACPSCLTFKENADIIEIDAASNNGVDEIRELINNIKLAPSYSKYKVYIIDEVHMLTTSAFNALLLTLEEPPKHIVFILATTNIEAVPVTILSRCQRLDFHKLSINDIINRMQYIIEQEHISIEEEAIKEIAYISDGGMRDALSILDQLSNNSTKITLNEVISHFGSISKKQIDDIFNLIQTNEIDKFLAIMHNLKSLSVDYKLLIRRFIDKIEEETIKSKKDSNYPGFSYQILKDMAFELASISNYVNLSIEPYQLIEITLLKYFNNNDKNNANTTTNNNVTPASLPNPNPVVNPAEEPKIIPNQNLVSTEPKEEKAPPKINFDPPKDPELDQTIMRRINNCFVNASKDYLAHVKQNWVEFIKNVSDKNILNLIIDTTVVAASDKVAILTSEDEATTELINKNLDILANIYNNKYQSNYNFVALTTTRWQTEREQYILNVKNKIKYTYIAEPSVITPEENAPITSDLEKVALNIFDKEKIEIK